MITKLNIGIIKTFNIDAFKRDTDEIDWCLATGNTDFNAGFKTFLRLIRKTIDKHAPLKKTSEKKEKNQALGHKGNKTFNEN